jgi:parvulin-like peptidyl-prolyl isomerase
MCGCSSKPDVGDRVVLKAGNLTLTVNDLEAVFSKANYKGPQDEFRRKKSFLEQQLDKMLIADAGLEIGLADSVEVDSSQQARILLDVLYMKNIADNLDLSEKQTHKFWKIYGGEIKVSHILVKTERLADSLYQIIKNNPALFSELATQFSEDTTTRDTGGELDYFRIGSMAREFEEVAFALKPDEVSKPVKTAYGWHIIKMVDRIKHSPEDFEDNEEIYRRFSTWSQREKLSKKLEKEVKKKLNYKIIDETLLMLQQKSAELREIPENQKLSSSAYISAEDLTLKEAQMPLATVDGLVLTAGEFIEHLTEKPSTHEYDLKNKKLVENSVDEVFMPKMMFVYAKQIGLDKDPDYLRQYEDARNGFVYRKMEKDYIQADVNVTDEEAKEYYEQKKQTYVEAEKVRVSEILVETEDEANRILDQLRSGVSFSKLAGKTIRPGYAEKKGDLGYIGSYDNAIIYKQAVKMKTGEIGGPLMVDSKYAVFKVTDKKPKRQKKFSEVEHSIRARLMAKKKLENLRGWLDERKKKVEHFMDLDLVKATLNTGKLEDET